MVRVWEKLAQTQGGIPARVLFYLDETISIPGWRWAPKSLLASSVDDSVLTLDERAMRFFQDDHTQSLGVPTTLGLKIMLPGYRVLLAPILPGLPLHPWPEVLKPSEDQILLQNQETGQWFRIVDWYRTKKLPTWTHEERLAWDKREDGPLCRAVDTGRCAILVDEKLAMEDGARTGCLVQVEAKTSSRDTPIVGHTTDSRSEPSVPLRVRRDKRVIMSELTVAEGQMMTMIQHLADVVGRDESTAAYLEVQKSFRPGSTEWDTAEEKVRQKMKQVMRAAWLAHPETLQQTMKDTVGEGMDDYAWVFIPKLFSHKTALRELTDQVWIVD